MGGGALGESGSLGNSEHFTPRANNRPPEAEEEAPIDGFPAAFQPAAERGPQRASCMMSQWSVLAGSPPRSWGIGLDTSSSRLMHSDARAATQAEPSGASGTAQGSQYLLRRIHHI